MDPAPDLAIFVIDLQDANKKLVFLMGFSGYYFLKVHLHHFSKTKSHQDVTKQQESTLFLLFFLDDRRIRPPIRIQEAQKHTDIKGSDQRKNKRVWSDINTRYLEWGCGDGCSFVL